ncbi:MAG: hypothetical protein ACP5P4_13725 [Steroidobacteraceae bacterium]
MSRSRQNVMRIGLCALVSVCAVGSRAWAEPSARTSICTRLAAQMRAAPATVLKDRVVPSLQPWIVNASSQPAQGNPAYRELPSIWRTMGGDGASFPVISSLPGTPLEMVSAYAGSGDCLQYQFFERSEGGVVRNLMGGPFGADLCEREGREGEFASVLGVPAFVAYGSLNPDNSDVLMIMAPWTGTAFARACPLSLRFAYRYEVTPLYCEAAAPVCAAARQVAPQVKRRYHDWIVSDLEAFNDYGGTGPKFRFGPAPSAQERALVARVRKLGLPRHFTWARHAPTAWVRHLHPFGAVYFPLTLAGKRYVGAAARTFFRHPPYVRHHWLLFVFRAPQAHRTRPVLRAAVAVRRIVAAVRSIEARNESVSVHQSTSTSLPEF